MRRRWSYLCLLVVTLCSACDEGDGPPPSAARRRTPPTAAAAPPPAAAAALPSGVEAIDAPTLLARARQPGKRGLVVNLWASWCGSCREEIPLLLKVQSAFEGDGIDFAFISADETKDFAAARKLMQTLSGPSPTLVIGTRAGFKAALNPRWRGGIPATFLFDATGKLRHFWEGPILEEEIAPVLQGFLAGDDIDGETRTAGP
jgi:thiol-disulfide isomerase/thioredoxin